MKPTSITGAGSKALFVPDNAVRRPSIELVPADNVEYGFHPDVALASEESSVSDIEEGLPNVSCNGNIQEPE